MWAAKLLIDIGWSLAVLCFIQIGGDMAENSSTVLIELSLEGADAGELDGLTRQLRTEIQDLPIDSIEHVSEGSAPEGAKAVEAVAIGLMAVKLAPAVLPPLVALLTSWINRKPTTPVEMTVKSGRKTVVIKYDPTKTSQKDLDALTKSLFRALKG
jgi:hypothetical protein